MKNFITNYKQHNIEMHFNTVDIIKRAKINSMYYNIFLITKFVNISKKEYF